MNRRLSAFVLFGLLASNAALVWPQTPSQSPPGRQATPILKATTRLVQINVVVHNKKGEPVEGLKKEDFIVLDQGKEQQVAAFSSNSAVRRETASNPPLSPNVFTNRGDSASSNPGSVTVILFDALNTPILDQFYARQQILKFLRQLQPQDHVAIYVLTTKIIVLNEFTQDATSLLQAIQKFGGYASAVQDAANPGPKPAEQTIFPTRTTSETDVMASRLRDFLDAADGKISDFANIDRAATTTSAIEAIANHVSHIPGRKNLVWVSASFPISIGFDGESLGQPGREQRSFSEDVEHAARTLNQANMAIYPVDARGLMTSSNYSAVNSGRFDLRVPPRNMGPDQRNFDTMIVLADRTGGKASYNTNDIEGAVQRAIADGQYTYTLGFYPTRGKWDGKFHELKVRVNEKGLTLRHRKGYFALSDPPNGPAENQAALDAAIGSPVEWTNLDLEVTLKSFDPVSHAIDIQVALDTHELALTSKDGRWNDTLFVFFGQLGAGDKIITSEKETFGLNLKPETYERLMKSGTKFSGRLSLSSEVINLRVVAQDTGSGAIGTVKIPIKNFLAAASSASGNSPAAQKP
jgi:VWFA-related protein